MLDLIPELLQLNNLLTFLGSSLFVAILIVDSHLEDYIEFLLRLMFFFLKIGALDLRKMEHSDESVLNFEVSLRLILLGIFLWFANAGFGQGYVSGVVISIALSIM